MFFIDLEPDINNPEIFKLSLLCYSKIKVEAPRPRKDIPQCLRCQSYGHTRAYFNHHPRCVRCGDLHDSTSCQKDQSQPATCALCGGPHPANYKGCSVHKELNKNRKLSPTNPWHKNAPNHQASSSTQEPQINTLVEFPPLPQNTHNNSHKTIKESPNVPNNTTDQLTSFITEFRSLINPLISLLTSLIEKLISNNGRK
ncbi:Pre-C2HC domain [Cinara cedri]|uniref:Pre-C2HC domain n=1 Tax=Cinara cedri TaxID=506608 RepID=A0A5E4N5T8_9HEMI|nr:Pre-C2HC domain [Cinara cedri]